MPLPSQLVTAVSARSRLDAARGWLAARPRSEPVTIAGASAEAAHQLVRAALRPGEAVFGWRRSSLTQLAAALAADSLATAGLAQATPLALEAVWAEVVQALAGSGRLGVYAPVADRPGLPRALARTVHEVRMAALDPQRLPADLAVAARAFAQALHRARLVDRPELFAHATAAVAERGAFSGALLLCDVAVGSESEEALIRTLAAAATEVFATVPHGDARTRTRLERALETSARVLEAAGDAGLTGLQRHLFSEAAPPVRPGGEEVTLSSAPGEAREAVEVVRRIHQEAARGVRFDRMAVLVRSAAAYRTALGEALRRAEVPAYFALGVRQPDPGGRALLALLACAEEGLSARGFAEYLSLGELPSPDVAGVAPSPPPEQEAWAPSEAEELAPAADPEATEEAEPLDEEPAGAPAPPRAPRKWEQLIADAAVIGGRARWDRRLLALEAKLRKVLDDPGVDEALAERTRWDLRQVEELRRFSAPVLEILAALPERGTWRDWSAALRVLAAGALRHPSRVLALLADLEPMGEVGPVSLPDVHRVLADRLSQLTRAPEGRRGGRVFVGTIDEARGLEFDVVLVPGLAERVFPQKVTDDPILPDIARAAFDGELPTSADRAADERLRLQLAVGAASSRVALSYPRLDVEHARPRVPSFYGLEVLRAAEGVLPDFTTLARRAERAVHARLGWPAPNDPELAIDATERDLAVLDGHFRSATPPPVGSARYLLEVNPNLSRSLRRYARRLRNQWSVADGLLKPSAEALAALEAHRLPNRAFSPTALQHFAACPYRFLLHAIHRLAPREELEAIEHLDPLQRGSLVHDAQYKLLSALRDEGLLPLRPGELDRPRARLDQVLDQVAADHEDLLAPTIRRVWQDTVDEIRADMRMWLEQMAKETAAWAPWRFELSFGLPGRDAADPHSTPEPVVLENGLRLRGSIDLVEQSPSGALRATDYKTGKARTEAGAVVGGGERLQPVLYALALERLFDGAKVAGGRLYYCTQAGGFRGVEISLNARAREHAGEVARIIGSAIDRGWFPAAPVPRACEYCDFRPICGDGEEARAQRKPKAELAELQKLRELE